MCVGLLYILRWNLKLVEWSELNLMFIGPCIIAIVDEWKTNLMSLAILFHLLCAQHVSDIKIYIFRSLWLCWWITTSVVLFSVRCVLEFWCGRFLVVFVLQARTKSSNTQRTENKTTDVVTHQHSRKLLKMDILMSETCWARNKWNKIASDIKLVFHSSTINSVSVLHKTEVFCHWIKQWIILLKTNNFVLLKYTLHTKLLVYEPRQQ